MLRNAACTPESNSRPQTPAQVIALQQDATRDFGIGPGSMFQLRPDQDRGDRQSKRGSASRRSSADPERPQSRQSTRSWEDPNRPWSAPTKEMVDSNWWGDAQQWWPENVSAKWESPYRPNSSQNHRQRPARNANTKEDLQWHVIEEGGKTRAFTPSQHESTWPAKPHQPTLGAYAWVTAGYNDINTAPKVGKDDEFPFQEAASRHLPTPPPLPGTFSRNSRKVKWDTTDLPWEDDGRAPTPHRPSSVGSDRSNLGRGGRRPPRVSTPAWSPGVRAAPNYGASPAKRPGAPVESNNSPKGSWTKPLTGSLFGFFSANKADPSLPSQEVTRVGKMLQQLDETRGEPLAERKRIFRDLQRELHPDKNVECEEEAKDAFQELMQQRQFYLSPLRPAAPTAQC